MGDNFSGILEIKWKSGYGKCMTILFSFGGGGPEDHLESNPVSHTC